MSRLAVLVLLLMAMLWQSVAMARIGSSVNVLADAEHAALHWHEEDHHHHDDGTYHAGDTAGQADDADAADAAYHVLLDHVSTTTALLTSQAAVLAAAGSSPPAAPPQSLWPDPMLDGLLRPPRARP